MSGLWTSFGPDWVRLALEPALIPALGRVGQALHAFARKRGWEYAKHRDLNQGNYYLNIAYNGMWGRISVHFVATGFQGENEYDRFNQVQDCLESELRDEPELASAVDLVVAAPGELLAHSDLGPGEVALDESFIESLA